MAITARTEISKSQVSLPPPGGLSRWAILGSEKAVTDIPYPEKRAQCAIYYEMYRQHPVVRAAIDKKAQYASAGGFSFKMVDPSMPFNDRKAAILHRFFRKSHSSQLFRLTFKDLDIYGESFWLIIRGIGEARMPIRAWRLNPRFMTPRVQDGRIIKWVYGPIQSNKAAREYDLDEILHFKLEDPENDTQGISPLHPLQRSVAQDIFAMEYNESFFKNSAQTGTIFIVKTSTEAEARRNRQWLEENYTGPENAHRPILLEGDVDVESSVSNAHEMEFLEGRMLLRQEIAMCLEVDLEKLGVHENSNRSVSREVDDSFHTESVWPRQVIVEEEINNVLILQMFGYNDILFDHNDKDPRRTADQADTDDKNLKSGRECLDEQRARLGLGKVKGGDKFFIMTPTGIVFLENFDELSEAQRETLLPVQGVGSKGQPSPATGPATTPLTRRQAEDVSQKE
jgi:HK97 family phage portal protein